MGCIFRHDIQYFFLSLIVNCIQYIFSDITLTNKNAIKHFKTKEILKFMKLVFDCSLLCKIMTEYICSKELKLHYLLRKTNKTIQ